jgi:hypothetical protein
VHPTCRAWSDADSRYRQHPACWRSSPRAARRRARKRARRSLRTGGTWRRSCASPRPAAASRSTSGRHAASGGRGRGASSTPCRGRTRRRARGPRPVLRSGRWWSGGAPPRSWRSCTPTRSASARGGPGRVRSASPSARAPSRPRGPAGGDPGFRVWCS